eukprot:TRINITY_DN30145_c0_g1_i1.p1 TRINITY_DN30145_c0_g1~~TRINITY_DN30145_c0_g1_i1.p1  ORF type:complete len:620 (+),score=124.01 TRINITY_DN30145_c0_g1_i1:182-2041(+)
MPASKKDVPWSERHRPRHLGEVVGNVDQIRKLAEWLRDWDDVVLKGKKKELPAPDPKKTFQPAPENINAKAALVSGPPGIGKTTTCSLVARCSRYKLMEFNASDARSKAVVDALSQTLTGNRTLKFGSKANESSLERAVIIMDECDGMAGGDKGGIQALIKLIENSKSPVICICNDRSDTGVRQLATHCYDLKFRRPENATVAKRIKSIVESEGQRVDLAAVESVVDACGQDIRQVINHLQFFGALTGGSRSCQKDAQVMLSPFDACSKMLSFQREPLSIARRLDLFYIDTDMVPLMIQENYLRPMEKRSGGLDETTLLERCAKASDLIATSDTLSGNFEVMNSAATMGTVYPSALMASPDETFARPSFPAWLQKRSSMGKSQRVLGELSSRLRASTTCGSRGFITCSYHEVLHKRLLKPLSQGLVKECAQALHHYGLSREFFSDHAPLFRQALQLEDGYRKVEAKLKTQLLHELQQFQQQTALAKRKKAAGEDGGAAKKKRGKGTVEDIPVDDGEGVEDDEGEPAAEDDNDIPGLVQKKTSKSKATKKNSKGTKDLSKTSLATWRRSKEQLAAESSGSAPPVPAQKKAILVMRYIDGHTNSVRRKMHISDILRPWKLF